MEGAELPTNLFIEKKGGRLNPKEKVSVIPSPFLNSLEFLVLIRKFRFTKRTPIHKKSIPGNKNTSGPSNMKTKIRSKALEILIREPNILSITQGFQIPFKRKPSQKSKSLRKTGMSKDQKILVNQDISDMLITGAIRECQPHPNPTQKDGSNHPVINLKKLNKLIPYQHFKMEDLHYLRYMLQ